MKDKLENAYVHAVKEGFAACKEVGKEVTGPLGEMMDDALGAAEKYIAKPLEKVWNLTKCDPKKTRLIGCFLKGALKGAIIVGVPTFILLGSGDTVGDLALIEWFAELAKATLTMSEIGAGIGAGVNSAKRIGHVFGKDFKGNDESTTWF